MTLVILLLTSLLEAGPAEVTDQIFAQWNKPDSPGCSVGVWKDGKLILSRGYGMANLEHQVPNTPQTAFYLGSTSKEFTAAVILLLVEQGRMKLDDTIRKALPEMPAYMASVTVRHLLEHTSGIRDYIGLWTLSGAADDAYLDDSQVLKLIARQKELNFAPGTEFLYSNSNYFLLGIMLRRAAFSQLPALAKDTIFTPLAMTNTLYYIDRFAILPKRATGYSPSTQGKYRINTATLGLSGDGGVFTTVEDLAKWLHAMENPQGLLARVFSQMRTRAKLAGGGEAEYGRGLMLKRYRGLDVFDHVGGLRGYRSDILYIPSEKLGVICLCNTSEASTGHLVRWVADVYLGKREAPVMPKLSAADLARKAGIFRDRDSGDLLLLAPTGNYLAAQYQGFQLVLAPETPMRFRSIQAPLDFELEFRNAGDKDEPSFVRIESESHKPAVYDRIELNRKPLENHAQYEGDFAAEDIDAKFKITFYESRLTVSQNDETIGELQYQSPDRFQMGTMNIEFLRGAEQKITGFRLNTGRIRRLHFAKVAAAQ